MSAAFRTAWIIGASSGIGRALVKDLAADGCRVVASARRAEALAALEEECAAGRVEALPLDIADADAVGAAVDRLQREERLPELVVVAAAAYEPAEADDIDVRLFSEITRVNYLGPVNLLAALAPAMLARQSGRIAVVASVVGYRGLPMAAAYGPTKAALINLCESLRPELAARGICLQVINPGFVETPLTGKNAFKMPCMITAEQAAAGIRRGLASRRFEITFPRRFTWFMKLLRLLPYGLYFPLVGAMTGVRRRAAEKRS